MHYADEKFYKVCQPINYVKFINKDDSQYMPNLLTGTIANVWQIQ